jgi:hypothetical protein
VNRTFSVVAQLKPEGMTSFSMESDGRAVVFTLLQAVTAISRTAVRTTGTKTGKLIFKNPDFIFWDLL